MQNFSSGFDFILQHLQNNVCLLSKSRLQCLYMHEQLYSVKDTPTDWSVCCLTS
jgi:hypothetical protein